MIRNWRRAPRKAYWRPRAFYRGSLLSWVDILSNQMMMMQKTGDNDFSKWLRQRKQGARGYRDMIRNSPARVPLWLAKRQWRLDGRRRIGIARGFVIGLLLAPRLYRERWQIWTGPFATLDGRRRQPAFYGIERQMSVSTDAESSC